MSVHPFVPEGSTADWDIDQRIAFSETISKYGMYSSEFSDQLECDSSSSRAQIKMSNVGSSLLAEGCIGLTSSGYVEEKSAEEAKGFVEKQGNNPDVAVILLRPSPPTEDYESIVSNLGQLVGINLMIARDEQECVKLSQQYDLSFLILQYLTDNDKVLVENLCSLNQSASIYLLGSQPNTRKQRQNMFTKYRAVCAMLSNPEELALKIAIDVAMKSRIMGDSYARNNDSSHAHTSYDQCIERLNRLNDWAQSCVSSNR